MNPLVALFFINSTLANFILGFMFYRQKQPVLKYFGIGLLLNGVAFAIWSTAVFLKPENLETWVTVGVLPFIGALVYYLAAGVSNLKPDVRKNVLLLAGLGGVVMFGLRTFIFPSNPGFSEEGLFFFNLAPVMQAIYVIVIGISFLPAVAAVAPKLKSFGLRTVFKVATITLTIGAIILITSTDTTLLYINGWAMGIAYLMLMAKLAFAKQSVFSKS